MSRKFDAPVSRKKTQEIIAKCLKQFDLRLFEEIGGNIQEKKNRRKEKKKKSTLRAFASRAKKIKITYFVI